MRIKIIRQPPHQGVDGFQTDRFEMGEEYEVGSMLAALFLAERWAAPVPIESPATSSPMPARMSSRRRPRH